jgi:hypothetical protein
VSDAAGTFEQSSINHSLVSPDQRIASGDNSYAIDGKRFLVNRIFDDDSTETVGTVLLKLLRMGSQD